MNRSLLLIPLAAGFFSLLILPAPSQTGTPAPAAPAAPTAPTAPAKAPASGKAKAKAKAKGKGKAGQTSASPAPAAALNGGVLSLRHESHHYDFPVAAAGADGTLWFAYVRHDGSADTVWLGRKTGAGLAPVAALSEPGVIHQPALAIDGTGRVWCFWGQVGPDEVMRLLARPFADGQPGERITLAASAGSDSFADARTDAAGRVWVAWQSLRAGEGDVFCRFLDPPTGQWSREIAVATEKGGDWEPRLAFDGTDGAWVVHDSSRGNEFNLYLARVGLDGAVKTRPIAHTPRFEGRASLAASRDGKSLWIASERGRVRWGLDVRGHENDKGINAQKKILFGRYDIAAGTFTEIPLGPAGEAGHPVNLPVVGVDAEDRPWVAYRYFLGNRWEIAVTRLDPKAGTWSARAGLPASAQGQDRHAGFVLDREGGLWVNWPSDERQTKACGIAGVYLARLDTARALPAANPPVAEATNPLDEPFSPSQATPERPADDRHVWNHGGAKYTLVWGDVHRHTDVSNCRTGFDGCIVDHFRYAYDIAKLDFMGTSDHTDIAKIYHPYEWWHNQRMHDAFHAPERFVSLYVYEREQRWPWGHRNVVFAERGGPLVYIVRSTYRNSPWQATWPVKAGVGEIQPTELWEILRASGRKVAIVSHTGATGMGTDWSKYEGRIDYDLENSVEIFQGARVSYEGLGTPQPTVGLRPGEKYTSNSGAVDPPPPAVIGDFGQHNAGVYRNALELGLKLGIFASSDHISQHCSYGGVYVKEFTREGIVEALQSKRSIGATDKIYVEFSCNGRPLGSQFETRDKPVLAVKVDGTAGLKRVTICRNESDHHVFTPEGSTFAADWTDEAPLPGENRYYLRVEQEDGNMAWASPVWVTVK